MAECVELVKSQQFLTQYDQLLGNTTTRTVGTFAKVWCIDGYSLVGSEVVQCTAAGWVPQPTPSCSVEGGSTGGSAVERRLREQLGDTGYALFVAGLVLAVVVLITLVALCFFYFRRQPRKNKKYHDHSYHQRAPAPAYVPDREVYPTGRYGYSRTRDVYPYDDTFDDRFGGDLYDDPYNDVQRRTIASDPFNLHGRDLFWTYMPDIHTSRETLPARSMALPRVHRSDAGRLTHSANSLITGSRDRDLGSVDQYRRRNHTFGYGWNPV